MCEVLEEFLALEEQVGSEKFSPVRLERLMSGSRMSETGIDLFSRVRMPLVMSLFLLLNTIREETGVGFTLTEPVGYCLWGCLLIFVILKILPLRSQSGARSLVGRKKML